MKKSAKEKEIEEKVSVRKIKSYYQDAFNTPRGKEIIKDLVGYANLHRAVLPNAEAGYDAVQMMCFREGQKSLILRILALAGSIELVDVMQDLINTQITEDSQDIQQHIN